MVKQQIDGPRRGASSGQGAMVQGSLSFSGSRTFAALISSSGLFFSILQLCGLCPWVREEAGRAASSLSPAHLLFQGQQCPRERKFMGSWGPGAQAPPVPMMPALGGSGLRWGYSIPGPASEGGGPQVDAGRTWEPESQARMESGHPPPPPKASGQGWAHPG